MRDGWRRDGGRRDGWAPSLELDIVRAVVARQVPGLGVRRATPLVGGLANCNLRLELNAPPGRAVLRIWQREPAASAVELAVLTRIATEVPVPLVLGATLADPDLGAPCALLSWIDGTRLQDLAPGTADDGALGEALGGTLAAIHRFGFAEHGFLDAQLATAAPIEPGSAGLLAWLHHCLVDGPGGVRLGAKLTAALLDFATDRGGLLDHPWAGRACLTHADFNPSNLLVRRDGSGVWRMAGVLDWEFAFAGGPALDFGHVLRPPWGDRPDFLAGVANAYRAAGADLPANWHKIAALADLFAWADFLGRPKVDPTVIASAVRMVKRIMAT